MAESNIFKDDWYEFYMALPTRELKAMFLDFIEKHKHCNIFDIINAMEDLKVIV